MGTLTYVAELSIGAICPLVVASIGPAFVDLNAQLTGAITLAASLEVTPPTLATKIANLADILAELQSSVTLGMPSVSFTLTLVNTLIARLEAQIALLQALNGLFAAAGVFVWTYDGDGPGLGSALSTALASSWPDGSASSTHANAVILGTLVGASWNALVAGGALSSLLGGAA